MKKPFVKCVVCYRNAVVFNPIPLCKIHKEIPEIPKGTFDSDEEIEFVDLDCEEYNPLPDDLPIPIYPV